MLATVPGGGIGIPAWDMCILLEGGLGMVCM